MFWPTNGPETLNRVHQVLRDLTPGEVPLGLSADKAAATLRRIKPTTATNACRKLTKDFSPI